MTTDDLRKALERADGVCPCRLPNVTLINGCRYCVCNIGKEQGSKCLWPGHAAIREAMRAAAEWGFEFTQIAEDPPFDEPLMTELAAILGPPERKEE